MFDMVVRSVDDAASKALRKRRSELLRKVADVKQAIADAEQARRECDAHDELTLELDRLAQTARELTLVALTGALKVRAELADFAREVEREHRALANAATPAVAEAEEACEEWLRRAGYFPRTADTLETPGGLHWWQGVVAANPAVCKAKARVKDLEGLADVTAYLRQNDLACDELRRRLAEARRQLMSIACV